MRRFGMMGLLGLCALGSGCATSATRPDIQPMFKSSVWNPAPVTTPAQTQVAMPPERQASGDLAEKPREFGLSKYFPGFKPAQPDPNRLATNQRPSWFGLRRLRSAPASAATPVQSKVYETDTRVALNRGAVPSILPVALRVPATDPAVTPTSATLPSAGTTPDAPKQAPDEGSNPLPPAVEMPVAGMPTLPPVDPRDTPRPAPATVMVDDAAPPDVRPTAGVMPLVETQASKPMPTPPADDKAVKAVEGPGSSKDSLGLPEATVPASYFGHKSANTGGTWINPPGMVLASPQTPPPAPKPSPQAGAKPASSIPKWKQNALCRAFRKVMKVDEPH